MLLRLLFTISAALTPALAHANQARDLTFANDDDLDIYARDEIEPFESFDNTLLARDLEESSLYVRDLYDAFLEARDEHSELAKAVMIKKGWETAVANAKNKKSKAFAQSALDDIKKFIKSLGHA